MVSRSESGVGDDERGEKWFRSYLPKLFRRITVSAASKGSVGVISWY